MANPIPDPLGIHGTVVAEKYLIGEAVGEGGFSVVYKAEHTIWKQPVALKCFKILANAPADRRDKLLDDFIQEGKLMATLSSRSAAIVQARDVGTFTTPEGSWIPYMVLEWLDGKPLDLVLWEEGEARLPLRTLPEAMSLLEPAAQALELVHAKNIAHRDIKPANFMVVGDPRGERPFVKVLDFGIAKVMADHAQEATALAHTGKEITAFTPTYGAPEQFSRSHGATGPWTDVFAFALILVEMIRGGGPALEGADYVQLAVTSRDPNRRPTPRTLGIAVSDAVEAVFAKALAVSPADRYSAMGPFWAALHEAVFGAPYASVGTTGQPSARMSLSSIGQTGNTPGSGPKSFDQGSVRATMATESAPPAAPAPASTQLSSTASAPAAGRSSLLIGGIAIGALAVGGVVAFMMQGKPTAPAGPVASSTASAHVASAPTASAKAVASAAAHATTCPAGMVLVPGGRFFMGSDDAKFKLWQPAHKVTLDTFCIDTYEVTAGDYKACSDQGECKRADTVPNFPKDDLSDAEYQKVQKAYSEFCTFGKPGLEKHPINCVTWELADNYCKVQHKRLPTEAEWEYAARGSDGRRFPWGDDAGDEKHMNACGKECNAWEAKHGLPLSHRMYDADDGYAGTAPVGSFPAGKTKFGAYDVVGNVWEWTSDWFETYKPDEVVNPTGAPAGDRKAIRGGAFNGGVELWLDPAFRYHQLATASSHGIGFRCAKSL